MDKLPPDTGPPAQREPAATPEPVESKPRGSIYARVFVPSAGIILALIIAAMVFSEPATTLMNAVNEWITTTIGWYYVLLVAGFIIVSLAFGLSRFGRIKLGPDDSKPEFGRMSWFAMLFSAGMGIGLVFWGVAEPLNHFATPPYSGAETAQSEAAARDSMLAVFMHWGIHPWAIYVVIGLAVAYAVHRKGRPISIRWILEPIFGDRVKGWLGDVVDVTAVVATLFGVATSLGFGVKQINAGLDYLGIASAPTDPEATNPVQILLIGIITGLALWSVVSGVKKGMKWLANANMLMAAALLLFVFIAGPTLFLFTDFFQSLGHYAQNIIGATFGAETFPVDSGDAPGEFQAAWTAFYWGWWISWAPFVGVFIARISRGRTIREFCLGVLLVPTAVSFLWFGVMGGSALWRELHGDGGLVTEDGGVSTDFALFQLLSDFPWSAGISVVTIFLITIFFVTSSDSGSLVIDMLSSGGNQEPPVATRVFWALVEGAAAAALLLVGGMQALQTFSVVTALPFSLIMILGAVALWRALSRDYDQSLLKRNGVKTVSVPKPTEPEPELVN